MKKTPLIIVGAVIAVVVVLIIVWQVKTISGTSVIEGKPAITTETSSVYKANCARCHGDRGQGYADKPSIQGTGYTSAEIKEIIKGGLDEMPSFPNIGEPALSGLSNYVSTL